MLYEIGYFLLVVGLAASEDCSFSDFGICMRDVVGMEGDFNVVSEENMKEVCNSKRQALQCASSFVQNCMKKGTRDLYEATTAGKVKVVEDMCTEGTRIHKGFAENLDCFANIQDEINFCNDKLKESHEKLNQATLTEKLKVFYACCVFGWHRNCLTKAARTKCDNRAADFVHYVSTVRLGKIQNEMCSSSYSSCHGLYGVQEEEQEKPESDHSEDHAGSSAAPNFYADILNVVFLFALLFTKTAFFRQTQAINFFLYT